MKARKLLAAAVIAVLALVVLVLLLRPPAQKGNVRSVRPAVTPGRDGGPVAFDPTQSAALFVGVRQFTDPTIAQVPYAVDDAVDLAFAFAVEPMETLVKPGRVVLALSGEPHKIVSKERLKKLIAAGATETGASRSDIQAQLRKQAAAVGPEGIFIVSLATHGYSSDGVPYVLAASSLLQDPETALSTAKMFDIAARARRSVVFADACRERVTAGRSARPRPLSVAPLIDNMSKFEGQVVFYAAAAGKYAYDNDRERNGVFTANVLAGLRCGEGAKRNEHGLITVAALAEYVEKHVRLWGKHHHPPLDTGIQVTKDGETDAMPLAFCSPVPPQPHALDTVEHSGSSFEVFDEDHKPLWRRRVDGPIADARIADRKEVVVATGGSILAFNAKGEALWKTPGDDITVRKLAIYSHLFPGRSEVVAISVEGKGNASRVSILSSVDGGILASYPYPGPLQDVVIAARTSRSKPKIIATGIDGGVRAFLHVDGPVASVLMLYPKRRDGNVSIVPVWYGVVLPSAQTIERLEIIDHGSGHKRDISLSTTNGGRIFLNFEGHTVHTNAKAHFVLVGSRD